MEPKSISEIVFIRSFRPIFFVLFKQETLFDSTKMILKIFEIFHKYEFISRCLNIQLIDENWKIVLKLMSVGSSPLEQVFNVWWNILSVKTAMDKQIKDWTREKLEISFNVNLLEFLIPFCLSPIYVSQNSRCAIRKILQMLENVEIEDFQVLTKINTLRNLTKTDI